MITANTLPVFLFITADPELVGGDTLTCGVCRKDFALADIVKFIQHKVLTCNKENYQCSRSSENGAAGGDNSPSAASAPVQGGADLRESLNSNAPSTTAGTTTSTASTTLSGSGTSVTRRHSISTTTAIQQQPPLSALTPPSGKSSPLIGSGNNNNHLGDLVKAELEGKQRSSSENKAECVDADTNTTNSGKKIINHSYINMCNVPQLQVYWIFSIRLPTNSFQVLNILAKQ